MIKWIKWYVYTKEYYSVLKKKGSCAILTTWMDFEDIMQSEISQTQNDKYCMMSFICRI